MRITVRGVHGLVVPHQVGIRGARNEIEDGEFVDPALQERVEKLGTEVVRYASRTDCAPASAGD
jgi:hypothetical protein